MHFLRRDRCAAPNPIPTRSASGCSRCVALQRQLEAQRWELVRERCAARSFRSLHERACARERAKHEEVKTLRADISGAAALRKEVERLKARLAVLSGDERSSPDRLRMKNRVLRSRVAELEGEVERLRSLNRQLQQATYGRRSERRCRSQRGGPAVTAPGGSRSRGQQPGAPGHGRTRRSALPVVEETKEAPERCCPHCARPYATIGSTSQPSASNVAAQRHSALLNRYVKQARSCWSQPVCWHMHTVRN